MSNMIILYTLPSCPKCQVIKMYLTTLGIPFTERNASNFLAYLTSKGFREVPILEIDGELFNCTSVQEVMFILRSKGHLSVRDTW